MAQLLPVTTLRSVHGSHPWVLDRLCTWLRRQGLHLGALAPTDQQPKLEIYPDFHGIFTGITRRYILRGCIFLLKTVCYGKWMNMIHWWMINMMIYLLQTVTFHKYVKSGFQGYMRFKLWFKQHKLRFKKCGVNRFCQQAGVQATRINRDLASENGDLHDLMTSTNSG